MCPNDEWGASANKQRYYKVNEINTRIKSAPQCKLLKSFTIGTSLPGFLKL